MNGYDIDGVLTRGIIPEKPYIVISGRRIDQWDKTLRQIGTEAPIYLRPYGTNSDNDMAGFWKAEIITKFRLTDFYEDNHKQARIIKILCPFCNVHMVIGGIVQKEI